MPAVLLCEFPAGGTPEDAVRREFVLSRVARLAVAGEGELLFAGRAEPDRDLIAVRLACLARAEAVMRVWRREAGSTPFLNVTLVHLAPPYPESTPLVIFP